MARVAVPIVPSGEVLLQLIQTISLHELNPRVVLVGVGAHTVVNMPDKESSAGKKLITSGRLSILDKELLRAVGIAISPQTMNFETSLDISKRDYNNEDPGELNNEIPAMALTHLPNSISQRISFERCSSHLLKRRIWSKVGLWEDCAVIETKDAGLRSEGSLDTCLCSCTDSALCLKQFCTRQKRRVRRYKARCFVLPVAHGGNYSKQEKAGVAIRWKD
jgi:hypothetical protein